MKDYSKALKKKFIQNICFKQVKSNYDALVLGGQTPNIYFNTLFNHVCGADNIIISYENNNAEYDKQLKSLSNTNRKRIRTNFGDIEETKHITQFIDADFCGTIETEGIKIKVLFDRQLKQFHNKERIFLFTVSGHYHIANYDTKNDTVDKILIFLSKVLKCSAKREDIRLLMNGNVWYYVINCKSYDVQIYYYYDTSPMFNIFIHTK